jgi:hypothetical protein
MGYSMTVPFKSAEEKERMKTFLLANKEILDNLKTTSLMSLLMKILLMMARI